MTALGALSCEAPFDWRGGDTCSYETVQIPAAWDCSDEVMALLAADEAALYSSAPAPITAAEKALVAHDSCEAGVASTRAALTELSNRSLRSQRAQLLASQCRAREEYRSGGGCYYALNAGAADVATPGANATNVIADQSGAAEHSGTNNQVAGVDEADFIKNDARYVYTIATALAQTEQDQSVLSDQRAGPAAGSPGELVIFDVWPPENAHEVSRIGLEGIPRKLQLEGDRLLVYASLPRTKASADMAYNPYGGYGGDAYGGSDCTYGYDCVPAGDGMGTVVTLYDVSDRTAPVARRRFELSGSYINSRRVGDVVYTLVADTVRMPAGVRPAPGGTAQGPDAAVAAFAELAAANEARIAGAALDEIMPSFTVAQPGAGSGSASVECGTIFEASGTAGHGFLSVIALTLADDAAAPRRATVVSEPGFTYASASALYVAVPRYEYGQDSQPGERTVIYKFELDGLDTRYAASGVVEGRVLNQFAMDEYAGYLRVAASNGHPPDPDAHSALTVLEQTNDSLVTAGKVDDIAPSEDIRSVRFSGDRGYVVTFKKTDPLFVFDLSQPRAPRVAGELKIPGFSTYIHPLDEGHLLSIGYDADDQGDFAWFRGIQLQVFDVADMSSPSLLHKTVIGTRGSSSEALDNHLAFTYFAPKRWLSVPITICEGGTGSDFGEMTFSGLYLYDVSLDSGFGLLGSVPHPPVTNPSSYDAASCGNWWTSASSQVKRSIIMDDYVLSISDTELKLNHAADLARDVAVLPLSR
jgi:Beta propeller domain